MSTAPKIRGALAKLPHSQQHAMAERLAMRLLAEETPAMLAALDVGIRSLKQKGAREYTRADLQQKVRRWARRTH